MTLRLLPIAILCASLGCGLIGGVFFASSSFVMRWHVFDNRASFE